MSPPQTLLEQVTNVGVATALRINYAVQFTWATQCVSVREGDILRSQKDDAIIGFLDIVARIEGILPVYTSVSWSIVGRSRFGSELSCIWAASCCSHLQTVFRQARYLITPSFAPSSAPAYSGIDGIPQGYNEAREACEALLLGCTGTHGPPLHPCRFTIRPSPKGICELPALQLTLINAWSYASTGS